MKNGRKILSAVLGMSVVAAMFSSTGAFAASGSLKSDTTEPFSVGVGKTYTFKITSNGTSKKPVVTVANGSALKTVFKGQNGNNYYYTVIAIGQDGSTSGVYMALPGQAAIRCCIVTVGTPASTTQPTPASNQQPTATSVKLSDLEYVTEHSDTPDILRYQNIDRNEDEDWLTSNANVKYDNGLNVMLGYDLQNNGDSILYRDYLVNGEYSQIKGIFALTQHTRNWEDGQFTLNIYGDNKLLYSSDPVTAGVLPQDFNVNISNVKMLRIETDVDISNCLQGGWYGAGLYNVQLDKQ